MEKLNFWLSIILAAVIFAVGLYDAFALYALGRDATVSSLVHEAAKQWPMVAFLAGLLAGHLFG